MKREIYCITCKQTLLSVYEAGVHELRKHVVNVFPLSLDGKRIEHGKDYSYGTY